MTRGFKILLIVLLLVITVPVVVDRVAVHIAQNAAAKRLQAVLSTPERPGVQIKGFPVLTQMIRRHVNEVVVHARDVPTDTVGLQRLDATLRDVQLNRKWHPVSAGTLSGEGLVTYSELARASGQSITLAEGPSGSVRVTRSVDVLGRTLEVETDAVVELDGDSVSVTARDVHLKAGSNSFGGSLPGRIADLLTFKVPVQGLPLGVRLIRVRAVSDGVMGDFFGSDIALNQ
jgi:hypothetical protein